MIKYRVIKFTLENRLIERASDYLKKRLLKIKNRIYLWLRLIWEIIKKNLLDIIREMNELINYLSSNI